MDELRQEAAVLGRTTVRQLANGVEVSRASRSGPPLFADQNDRISAMREKVHGQARLDLTCSRGARRDADGVAIAARRHVVSGV